MTLLELLAAARGQLADTGGHTGAAPPGFAYFWQFEDRGCRWRNADLIQWLADAEDEACLRARLLVDDTTPHVARLPVAPGVAELPLSPWVIDVTRAQLESQPDPLLRAAPDALDARRPGWDRLAGTPRSYCLDGSRLVLTPIPVAPDTLRLRVIRRPLAPLGATIWTGAPAIWSIAQVRAAAEIWTMTPEIAPIWHGRLLNWVCAEAYAKADSETANAAVSADYRARFERDFGPRPSIRAQRQQRDRRPAVVRAILF
ncbi:MAG TPA: hypothetical protein PL166_11895 [Candidatus Contendobacter sp.]|nr:hypothetical protein [Candidatus Contendobacter sp.]HRD50283.1 hypothetical protein [Candidatus Contendobacter sp.]